MIHLEMNSLVFSHDLLSLVLKFFACFSGGFDDQKTFSNKILKRISYAAFLSLFITSWFLHPGSKDMAPIFPIYLISLLESESLVQMRLIRPLLLVFFSNFDLRFSNI